MSAPITPDSGVRAFKTNTRNTTVVNTTIPTDPQSADGSTEMGDLAHVVVVFQTDLTMEGVDNPGLGKPRIGRCSSLE